jgi:hypothetical protein
MIAPPLAPWPEKPFWDTDDTDWMRYERARADAWEARCRMAVEALKKINTIYPRCWDLTNGNLAIIDKKNVDAFEDAHGAVSEALALIGELPPAGAGST